MTKVTEADIDALKAKNGLKTVHIVTFNKADDSGFSDDDDYPELDFVFKKVGFDVLAASAALGQDNPIKALKMQMQSCLLWGDEKALFDSKDATVFTSVMQQFVKITEARTATLKKN